VTHRRATWPAAVALAALVLVGCTQEPTPSPAPAPSPFAEDGSDGEPEPGPDPEPEPEPTPPDAGLPEVPGPDLPDATDEPVDVLTDLDTPWDLDFLPGGAVVVTSRDGVEVLLLRDTGPVTLGGPGAQELADDTDTSGEGGLLGVAVVPPADGDEALDLLLYRTTSSGNQVVRTTLDPEAGELGALRPVLTGIPAGRTHNGGRIAVGPDGMLWVATGDAGAPDLAQDESSLAGKVLRLTLDGAPAPDNPEPGSPVWSLGHRNVQGLGWDADGALVASEFGQDRIDELNVLEPGGNYGWPVVEGTGGGEGLIDPVITWTPAEASPSGLAVTGDAVYVAALRGRRLWQVPWAGSAPAGEVVPLLVGDLGRLRHVAVGPDGALWVLTHNTDGRGSPQEGDDRLVRLRP
jgi:glucose/arabinose dehydrogenase